MAAIDDLYAYIEAQALAGDSTGWALVVRRLTDEDPFTDQAVMLMEDGGGDSEIGTGAGVGDEAVKDPAVQVMVRAAAWDSDVSRAKADAIFAAVHGLLNIQLNGTLYYRVRAQSPEPIFPGFDEKNRPLHTISFMMLTDA